MREISGTTVAVEITVVMMVVAGVMVAGMMVVARMMGMDRMEVSGVRQDVRSTII